MEGNVEVEQTSATMRVWWFPKEHLFLKSLTRSSNFPCLGTLTVTGFGWALPSVDTTVKVIVLSDVDGKGNDRYMNGSNVTDTFLQIGHTSVDRYWPCNANYYNKIQLTWFLTKKGKGKGRKKIYIAAFKTGL